MAAIDARGGGGREGLHSVMSLTYDKAVRRGTGAGAERGDEGRLLGRPGAAAHRLVVGQAHHAVQALADRAKMCMHDMAAIDARGGGGREGLHSVMSLTYDKAPVTGPAEAAQFRRGVALAAAVLALPRP
jgi:hypothetical protein